LDYSSVTIYNIVSCQRTVWLGSSIRRSKHKKCIFNTFSK